jgi:hypothetical protein
MRLMRKALQELLLIVAILEKYSQCEKYLQKALQYSLNSDEYYLALKYRTLAPPNRINNVQLHSKWYYTNL